MNTREMFAGRSGQIRKVLLLTLFCNVAVSAGKIAYGKYSHSVAITADGFHSMFDGISNVVGFAGSYIASRPPDEEHPYGHRKYETIFTIFIGVMMFLTCVEIFKEVYRSFSAGSAVTVTPGSFGVMLITMAINVFVTTYEKRMGERLGSEFLIADAQHTKSDIYATTGVIIGLVLIRLGFSSADWAVGAVVGLLVARAGITILRDAAEVLADRRQTETAVIKDAVCGINNVLGCHKIRTRGTNGSIFIDLHIVVDPQLSIDAGHRIAHDAEERIREKVSGVIDVVVHVEPLGSEHDREP